MDRETDEGTERSTDLEKRFFLRSSQHFPQIYHFLPRRSKESKAMRTTVVNFYSPLRWPIACLLLLETVERPNKSLQFEIRATISFFFFSFQARGRFWATRKTMSRGKKEEFVVLTHRINRWSGWVGTSGRKQVIPMKLLERVGRMWRCHSSDHRFTAGAWKAKFQAWVIMTVVDTFQ